MDDLNLSAPIACALPADQQRRETEDFRATLGPHVIAQEKLDDGARITFRNLPSVGESLNRLVELDSDCCAFLAHQIDVQGDEITLTTRSHGPGIPLAQQFLTELAPVAKSTAKLAGLVGVFGLACLTPLFLSAVGIGIALPMGALGVEIAVLGLAFLGVIAYVIYRKRNGKGKATDANRCGC